MKCKVLQAAAVCALIAFAATGCVVRTAAGAAGSVVKTGVGVTGDAVEAGVDAATPDKKEEKRKD